MKTYNRILFNNILFTLLPLFVYSQPETEMNNREWGFSECVVYGMDHNITLRIEDNLLKKEKYSYEESIWQFAPSINGWSSSNMNLNRSTDQNNQISSGKAYSVGYGVNASLSLFSGLSRLNNISAMKYNKLAYTQRKEQQKNLLYFEILNSFAQAVFAKQQVKIAEDQVELTLKNKEIIESKVDVGLFSLSAIDEINATLSGNQLSLNKQRNAYLISKLNLTQLIEVPDSVEFDLSDAEFERIQPTEMGYTISTIYKTACENLPELKEKEYRLLYYKKILRVNQGHAFPRITLEGDYYSRYYSTDTLANGRITSFENQYTKYSNPSVSLNVNIPIFNKRSNEFLIKKSRIELENAVLELELQKKEIYKEIQIAIQQLSASFLEYQSALDNLKFVEKSFNINNEKYILGLITSADFITAQNQLLQAKTNVLSAKYGWIVQAKTILLYSGSRDF